MFSFYPYTITSAFSLLVTVACVVFLIIVFKMRNKLRYETNSAVKRRRYFRIATALAVLWIVGFLAPLGSRMAPTNICVDAGNEPVTVQRNLVFGETLNNLPSQPPQIPLSGLGSETGVGGCGLDKPVKYSLRLF